MAVRGALFPHAAQWAEAEQAAPPCSMCFPGHLSAHCIILSHQLSPLLPFFTYLTKHAAFKNYLCMAYFELKIV